MRRRFSSSRTGLLLMNTIVLLSMLGCRTYGGYGSEEALYSQIETINERFAGDLERARAEQSTLQRAAGQLGDIASLSASYEELLARHEELVSRHEELASRLKVKTGVLGRLTSSYRDINRALGMIVTEQKTMRDLYQEFAQQLAGLHPERRPSTSRYEIVPPFYEQIHSELSRLSVSQAIDERANM